MWANILWDVLVGILWAVTMFRLVRLWRRRS